MDTYLSLAASDRRRPSVADVADLAAGGLRQRLRIADDLAPGLQLAGLLALMTVTALAAGSAILEAPTLTSSSSRLSAGSLALSIAVWALWLLAAVVHAAAPDRWCRWAVGLGVLVTAGIVPAATLTGLHRPPLAVLLPQLVLGVVALGASRRRPWWTRLMPITAAAVTVPVIVDTAPTFDLALALDWCAATVMPAASWTLLIGATLLALSLATRRDYRGAWALLILLTPIGMLAVVPIGAMLEDSSYGHPVIPAWSSMVIASVLVAVVGPALVLLSIAARQRLPLRRRPLGTDVDRCPTCGKPSTPV